MIVVSVDGGVIEFKNGIREQCTLKFFVEGCGFSGLGSECNDPMPADPSHRCGKELGANWVRGEAENGEDAFLCGFCDKRLRRKEERLGRRHRKKIKRERERKKKRAARRYCWSLRLLRALPPSLGAR